MGIEICKILLWAYHAIYVKLMHLLTLSHSCIPGMDLTWSDISVVLVSLIF